MAVVTVRSHDPCIGVMWERRVRQNSKVFLWERKRLVPSNSRAPNLYAFACNLSGPGDMSANCSAARRA